MDLTRLIKAKEKLNYSSVDIAARSGVPVSTVYKIFQGQTGNPRQKTLEAIERALGLRYDVPEGTGTFNEPSPYGKYIGGSSAYKYETPVKKQGEYTTADLDELPEEIRVELIDGVLYDMAAPDIVHQILVSLINTEFNIFIKKNKGKCIVVPAPVGIRVDANERTELQPDVSITCDRCKIKNGRVYGAPDLVVEILSPSNRRHDTVRKMKKYRESGVKEYWIVDPEEKVVLVHLFGDNYSIHAYTFHDQVPATIYNGECVVDFAAIYDYIIDIFPDWDTYEDIPE